MKSKSLIVATIVFIGIVGCAEKKPADVSFSKHIQPILSSHCLECHKTGGQGFSASGLNMETYAALMKGTKFGPVIKPGDALSSTLVRLIKGLGDPSINMPHGDRKALSAENIAQIENWVNQGAKNK